MLTQGRWARLDDITAPDPCPHAPGQPHAPPPHLPPAPPPFFAGLWTIWRSEQGAPLLAPHSPSDPLPVCHRRPTTTTYLLWVKLPANHHNLLTVGAAVGQPPRPTHCVGRRRPTTQTYFTVCRRWPTIQTYVLCAAAGSPLDRPRRPAGTGLISSASRARVTRPPPPSPGTARQLQSSTPASPSPARANDPAGLNDIQPPGGRRSLSL